jgi:hypothetical protein
MLKKRLARTVAALLGATLLVGLAGPIPALAETPAIDVQGSVNGEDADVPPGPQVAVGATLSWWYNVTNMGDVTLTGVVVADDQGLTVSCPKSTLYPGEAMTCTASSTAIAGLHQTTATASSDAASDTDDTFYTGLQPVTEGCGPGFWRKHTEAWPPTGYSPSQLVGATFTASSAYSTLAAATLHQALSFKPGKSGDAGAAVLLKAATAALLSAAHPSVAYPRSEAAVLADVNAALTTGDRAQMVALANELEADAQVCPLG